MDFGIVFENADAIASGLRMTILLSIVILTISTPVALLVALSRQSSNRVLSSLAAAYAGSLRAIPALVVLFMAFFALPQLGFRIRALPAAVLGLTLSSAAYLSEDFRAGILAVAAGQFQAAKALGMSYPHTIRRIVMPQAIPVILPIYMTRAILIVKGTSLASIVGVSELTGETSALIALEYKAFEFLVVAAILYLIVNGLLAGSQVLLERKFAIN